MALTPTGLSHQDEVIDDYVRGHMSARKRAAVEAHLDRCPRCRGLVADCKRRLRRSFSRPGEVLSSVADAGVDTAPNDLVTRPRRVMSTSLPVLGSLFTLLAFITVLLAAWHAGGRATSSAATAAEDFTVAGAQLSDADVSSLRKAGWTCADLTPLGLRTAKIVGFKQGQIATVSTTYTVNGKSVVVAESRWAGDSEGAATVPTPTAVAVRGSEQAHKAGLQRAVATAEPTTLAGVDGGSYAISSTLDSEQTKRVVARLDRLSSDRVQDDKASSSMSGWERLSRGWARLVEPNR
jgi:predicted anti-sigma-YlaC factor YlaD